LTHVVGSSASTNRID